MTSRRGGRIQWGAKERVMNRVSPTIAEKWRQDEQPCKPANNPIQEAGSEECVVRTFMQQQLQQQQGGCQRQHSR